MWPKPWQDPALVQLVGEKKEKKAKENTAQPESVGEPSTKAGKGKGKTAGKGLRKAGKGLGKGLHKAGKGLGKVKGKTTGKAMGNGVLKFASKVGLSKAKMKSVVWTQLDVKCISADYRNLIYT